MGFDDEVVGQGESFGGHVVDVHDSSLNRVVGETECVHKGDSHDVLADVVTNPKFLEGGLPVTGDLPFVYCVEP
jgi:hypothetical protein